MADYTFTADSDFSKVFADLAKVSQGARQAGDGLGKGLSDGLATATANINALSAQIKTLVATRSRLQVDSSEYKAVQQQIDTLQGKLQQARGEKLKLQVDATAVGAAATELGKIAPAARQAGAEMEKASKSSTGYSALNGVIQGVAFSLANTLTNAAGTALQSLGAIPQQVRQFDSAKAAVRTLGVDADDLGGRMLKLSASTKGNVSAVELLKASYDVASSGFASAADATNILAAAQDGAVGGFTDINTVADAATSVLNAYGLTSDKARGLIDGFIQTQNDGKITVGQYAGEIGRIAPVAAASGVSINELNAAISAATAQGVPVGSTFAGMRQAISSILKPSVEASAYAKTLGLDFSAAALKAKGFGQFMQEVAQKTGGSADAIIKLTGSVEAQAAIQPLVNDGLAKYNQFLNNQAGSAGAAGKAADVATNTVDGSLKRLANTFSNLAVSAFGGLAAPVTAVINAFNGVLNVILGLPSPVKAVAGVLVGLTAAYVGARTAAALFKAVLATDQIQGVILFFRQLGATIAGDFQRAITAAQAKWTAFTASVQSQGLLTTVRGIGSAFLGLAGQVAVVALRFAYIAAAVEAYQKITGAAAEASQGYNERLIETQKALDLVRDKTDETSTASAKLADSGNGVIKFFENLPGVLRVIAAPLEGVVRLFYTAVEGFSRANALNTIRQQTEQLQASFTQVQQAAQKTFEALRNSTTLTPDQQKSVADRLAALKAIKEQAEGQAKAYQDLAVSYRAANRQKDAQIAEANANAMKGEVDATNRLIAGLQGLTDRTAKAKGAKAEIIPITKEQAKAEEDLNKIIREAPVRNLDAQIAVGQQMVNLAKSLGDLEQSRFNVTKSALQFELQKAQERGASETQINAIKRQIDQQDQAALSARYRALQTEQALQQTMLKLSQEKARQEADIAILQQRLEVKKAEAALDAARAGGDAAAINTAQAQLNLQNQILGITQDKRNLLDQTQPIERAIAAAQAETARNGEQAKAAAMGFKLAADGTLTPLQGIRGAMDNVATLTAKTKEETAQYRQAAADAGLQVGKAKDGTLVLGKTWGDVNAGVEEVNRSIDGTTKKAGDSKSQTDLLRKALVDSGLPADKVAQALKLTEEKAKGAQGEAGKLKGGLKDSSDPAANIASAFVSTGKNAPAAAQGARDFAAWLSKAKTFAENIRDINLEDRMAAVRDRTKEASIEAGKFFTALERASRLPGSRWSGGPVEAGSEYRINELGQEAFLSAGRLSLIDAAPNSIWRAPSDGVVIPAGITARLQASAAVQATGGGSAGVAELAIEVGKLREEVGNLARRDWSVRVTQRTGPTGSQVLRTLLS